MKQYRGYYIDGVQMTCKADIDRMIKENNVRMFTQQMQMMYRYTDPEMMMAASIEASKTAEYLVKHCGMTWGEIEDLEIAAIA